MNYSIDNNFCQYSLISTIKVALTQSAGILKSHSTVFIETVQMQCNSSETSTQISGASLLIHRTHMLIKFLIEPGHSQKKQTNLNWKFICITENYEILISGNQNDTFLKMIHILRTAYICISDSHFVV